MEGRRQGVASLFEDSDPRARAGRNALLLLAFIVVGGAVVRFWGLGNVGLHGDEKTMVLPAMHLLLHGTPDMPSGFLYPRALAQLYLMAESARVFGLSEWAWRFPSAVCGVLLIVLTWTAGRRFLEPRWNLALTAAVALLPMFIVDAQTARMYVFLVTGVTGFMALLFAWERTGRSGYLVAAIIEMAVSLQFHTLSIFAAWLCFLPGLVSGDRRRLGLGTAAFALIAVEYLALNHWISAEYPHQIADSIAAAVTNAPRAAHAPPFESSWPLLAALPAVALSWLVIRARGVIPVVLLAASLVAQVSRLYHVAILLFVAALVLARRDGKLPAGRLGVYLGVCALLGAAQVGFLWEHRAGTLPQILGLLLGWPSVRPFIALSHVSQVAMLVAGCGAATGLWRLAHRQLVPDHVLLFCLGVWLPLLQIGYLRWDIPPRYAEAQVMPLLIAAFASGQWATRALARRLSERPSWVASQPLWGAVAAGVLLLLVIDPVRLEAAVDPTYAHYPDHKGAARFVESLHPKPDDVIVAEDTLMQTYYLGHVDYWLMNQEVAAQFMHEVDGRWLDEYTNAPLIGTGRQLQRLVDSRDRGAIYVIGSGEDQQDGRQIMRGLGIAQELESPAFHLIYVGSDGLTDVWKVDPPKRPLSAGR
ncbi:MAG TPA: glycosyltransferase family 39 protein [Steroidobacteraceae bacterium]|nr:glycosyltransferase family 39 protein [Steroidobacteraceae bacterium]